MSDDVITHIETQVFEAEDRVLRAQVFLEKVSACADSTPETKEAARRMYVRACEQYVTRVEGLELGTRALKAARESFATETQARARRTP